MTATADNETLLRQLGMLVHESQQMPRILQDRVLATPLQIRMVNLKLRSIMVSATPGVGVNSVDPHLVASAAESKVPVASEDSSRAGEEETGERGGGWPEKSGG
jgi:hypothetical protein